MNHISIMSTFEWLWDARQHYPTSIRVNKAMFNGYRLVHVVYVAQVVIFK